MVEKRRDSRMSPDNFDLEGLSKPRSLGDRIESELRANPNIALVGQLSLLQPDRYTQFRGVRDFFVVPTNPPSVTPLDYDQVALLEASVWKMALREHIQDSKALAVLQQFAAAYNDILKTVVNPADFSDVYTSQKPFVVTDSFRNMKIRLGTLIFQEPYPIAKTIVTTQSELSTPELEQQAVQLGISESKVKEISVPGVIRVRLFPPKIGEWIYLYEKGYYVDGNIADTDEYNSLVWNGSYVSTDEVSSRQLNVIAQGGCPLPEIEYLPTSLFEGDTDESRKIRFDRLSKKTYREMEGETFGSLFDHLRRLGDRFDNRI